MQTEMSQDHCLDQAQQVTQHGINHEVQTNTDCHNHLVINHEVQTNTDCHNHLAINQNIDHKSVRNVLAYPARHRSHVFILCKAR